MSFVDSICHFNFNPAILISMMNQRPLHHSDSPREHLLHRLYTLQQEFLHISPQAMQQVAAEYQLSLGQVVSVVEFYSFFLHATLWPLSYFIQ